MGNNRARHAASFTRRHRAAAIFIALLILLAALPASDSDPLEVLPLRPSEGAVLLNGDWKFRYIAGLDAGPDEAFTQPSFDVSSWKTMPVPGHWELHSFAEPKYESDTDPGLGLYRRTFKLTKSQQGKRVFLRFDGVLFGMTVFVNGHNIGEWGSSFNPVTFDITGALLPGDAENTLAVRVTTRSKGWDFDTMDCWGLSGIFRDVTLFALPETHLSDYTARTTLNPNGTVDLSLQVKASAPGTVSGRVLTPEGQLAGTFRLPLATDSTGTTRLTIANPKLWTAETPWLYRLELDLESGGRTIQSYNTRIGLRQVTVEDGILKLNGTPIKLRGIDHHDIWPAEGRVATEQEMRHDLELIKAANINFIRTSHYPPNPRFIELADEMGVYIDCEVPFIHGRQNLKNPDYQDVLYTRAKATLLRDKNHPSIILWSIGNENPINDLGLNTGKLVKSLDPTRPITFPTIGSYFKDHYAEYPAFVDLYSPHYPSAKNILDYNQTLTRPVVVTEYAHERGLSRSGEGVQDIWEAMYHSPRVAGGAVWMFQDQGILRYAADKSTVQNADLMVWLDDHRYYDTHGYFAVDGIVYSDRTPQIDYFQVRKVYSPIQIPEQTLAAGPTAKLHLENRFDFLPLTGMKLTWSLTRNNVEMDAGTIPLTAAPHAIEALSIPLHLPTDPGTDVFTLELKCLEQDGQSIYERGLRIDTSSPAARWAALKASLPASNPALDVTDSTITVRTPAYELHLDRQTGHTSITDSAGTTLLSNLGPHTGRVLTINELGKNREGEAKYWRGELLTGTQLKTSATQTSSGVEVIVHGLYPRPGVPAEALEGEYRLLFSPSGAIEITYNYKPLKTAAAFVETGFALEAPATQSELRWLGQGPYAAYPGKDRLDEYGLFHLNREDQFFPGNRRGVEIALLTHPSGTGILLTGNPLTISLDYLDQKTVLSQVTTGLEKDPAQGFSGSFTLLPIGTHWPQTLTNWFGPANQPAQVHLRYPHSYDQ